MPTQYQVSASLLGSSTKPDFSLLASPPYCATDFSPTTGQITEFKNALAGFQCTITSSTTPEICAELRQNIRNWMFVTGAPHPLGTGNPIHDVYVNNSRESSSGDVWREAEPEWFAIHPISTGNGQMLTPYKICVNWTPNLNQNPPTGTALLADLYASNV